MEKKKRKEDGHNKLLGKKGGSYCQGAGKSREGEDCQGRKGRVKSVERGGERRVKKVKRIASKKGKPPHGRRRRLPTAIRKKKETNSIGKKKKKITLWCHLHKIVGTKRKGKGDQPTNLEKKKKTQCVVSFGCNFRNKWDGGGVCRRNQGFSLFKGRGFWYGRTEKKKNKSPDLSKKRGGDTEWPQKGTPKKEKNLMSGHTKKGGCTLGGKKKKGGPPGFKDRGILFSKKSRKNEGGGSSWGGEEKENTCPDIKRQRPTNPRSRGKK